MKAIYACKLYKASNRKDKIKAAIADPLNAELVTQLKSYLDDDFQDELEEAEAQRRKHDKTGPVETDESKDVSDKTLSEGHSGLPPRPSLGGGRSSLSEKFDALIDEEDNSVDDAVDTDIPSDEGEQEGETDSDLQEIDESTDIPPSGTECPKKCLLDIVDEVKSLLNTDDSTRGMNRVLVKDNELWVYYNDNINLNNVMGPVIEKLNTTGYNYLDFNRLARSDNAIVFQNNAGPTPCTDEEELDV